MASMLAPSTPSILCSRGLHDREVFGREGDRARVDDLADPCDEVFADAGHRFAHRDHRQVRACRRPTTPSPASAPTFGPAWAWADPDHHGATHRRAPTRRQGGRWPGRGRLTAGSGSGPNRSTPGQKSTDPPPAANAPGGPAMDDSELRDRALAILEANHRDGYTVPAQGLYPYQWCWDSGPIALGWAAAGRWDDAWGELERLLSAQWPSGMVPHIVFWSQDDTYFPGPDVWATGRTPAHHRADPTSVAGQRRRPAVRSGPGPRPGRRAASAASGPG